MSDLLKEKAFAFAVRVVRLAEYLQKEKKEFILSKKISDSGVNVGLFIEEARQGDDRNEFRLKYSVANKEAFKSNYLLHVIHGSGYITEDQFNSLLFDCEELQKMLSSALKTVGRPSTT